MTAEALRTTPSPEPQHDVLSGPDPVAAAAAHIAATALQATSTRAVGLELEFHLVELARPEARPTWPAVQALAAQLPPMPAGSTVTFEPGGQIELSTPPGPDVVAAVAGLAADRDVLRAALRERGYGAAALGADPVRPPERVNPHPRYAAMETHFTARGCGGAGRSMMTSTAALQVNLDAGPMAGWAERLGLLRSMVPMLVAASTTSPYLGGRASGWASMRQETWTGIDCGRSDPVAGHEPAVGWALYALDAPVMLLSEPDGGLRPVPARVTFGDWLRVPALLGRPATGADLDYHLTTLFPPVRPRGYVEVRCVDALPDRWWPAMAALVATLADVPAAADEAADLCAPTTGAWESAARDGLRDPAIRRTVAGCAEVAAAHAPAALKPDVEALADLLASGRTVGDELRATAERHGPLRLLEEHCHE